MSNDNHASSNRKAAAIGNANKRTRPRRSATAVNANTNYNAAPKPTAAEGNANISSNANHGVSPPSVKVADPVEGSAAAVTPGLEAWAYPPRRKPEPDPDILLPEDFRELEAEKNYIADPRWQTPHRRLEPFYPAPVDPMVLERRRRAEKTLNTTGGFAELLGKRKVFVNVTGETGNKITARLREYGWLEVVKTAGEAEAAIHFYDWLVPTVNLKYGTTTSTVNGVLIVTIRDPSQGVPRIIWREQDTDGGWIKRGKAFDKLTKRFISELKKLRGEK